mmetsp:Transcript_24681/g.55821  ORF Transcript_24681/g.55821 Transcript_24681/m.55821 type:complete len:99 (-) Transcript_24681:501-797(-)
MSYHSLYVHDLTQMPTALAVSTSPSPSPSSASSASVALRPFEDLVLSISSPPLPRSLCLLLHPVYGDHGICSHVELASLRWLRRMQILHRHQPIQWPC